MDLTPDQGDGQSMTKKYGDGFVIENGIIKGIEQFYPMEYESIGELLFHTLNRTPERIVQIDGITGMKKTYKNMKDSSVRLAIWMKKEAIGTGDIVALCSRNHPDIDSIIFATTFVGATYAAFPGDLDLQSAKRYINYVKPKVIFACKSRLNVLQKAAELENHEWKIIALDESLESMSTGEIFKVQSSDEIQNFQVMPRLDPTKLCMIIPTSGTTGTPKLCCFSYENFMRWISSFHTNQENMKNPNRIVLTYLNPEWTAHSMYMLRCFLNGNTQIFHADFDPHDTCRIIEKYKVDMLIFDTYHASLLCQSDALNIYDLGSVSLIQPLGTKLFPKIKQTLQNSFLNAIIGRVYGSSETTALTYSMKRDSNPESEGTVLPNVQLKIVDIQIGSTLGPNQVGEIRAKKPYMMTGYYKDPMTTNLAFDDEGWFRTGDKGYYDENGEVFVVGRLKEVIRFRHVDIHPFHVEKILLSHPDITDAAVVGIDHDVNVEHPVAFLKIKPGSSVTEQDVLDLTRELEYSDTLKDSVIFIDEIPRLTNGKINKRALRKHAEKFYKCHQDNCYS